MPKDLTDTDPDLTPPSAVLAPEARQSWGARIADDVAATHELMRETRGLVARVDERCERMERRLAEVAALIRDDVQEAHGERERILSEVQQHRQAAEGAATAARDAADRVEEALERLN